MSEWIAPPLDRHHLQGCAETVSAILQSGSGCPSHWLTHWPEAKDAWALLMNRPPSLQTFAQYGQRFGGIEPHFKDYKSAAFDLTRSHIRHPKALGCLLMLIAAAQLFAIQIGFVTGYVKKLVKLDWHHHRGISFLQLGLRELNRRGLRFDIEESFLDDKSNGFNWEKSGLREVTALS